VAVLFRRLTQLREYEQALRAAGIPIRLARGGGFYQAPEVRDLGELVASLFEPLDAIAWAALLRSPLCAVGDAALLALAREGLARLGSRPGAERAESALAAAPEELLRLRRFLGEWHELRALRDRLPVGDLLERAADRLDLVPALLSGPEGERRVANVRKAISMARRFAAGGGTAPAFARRLRELARRPPREPEADLESADAVAVLSVHQSKGLEWPIVLVPDLGAAPRRDGRRALLDGGGRLCAALWDPGQEEFVTTASVAAAKAEAARADAAESRRLLYVALTRARDHLVLSGARGRNGGETWRDLVEPALATHPGLALRVPAELARTFAVAPVVEGSSTPPPAPRTPIAPPRLRPPRPAASPRLPVTSLAEYARCPRRFALLRAGAAEPAQVRGVPQDDPGRATARGTLAHAMLAEVDLSAPPLQRRAQLAAAAARRGHDPDAAGVRRIAADVWRFIDSPAGRRLAQLSARGALRREVPFLLRLDGDGVPPCYLVGAIDALVEDAAGVTVIDFKYALPRRDTAERYRHQLLGYAVAATRARPGARVRAQVQFLRGSCSSADVTPTPAELARFAREAPFLAARAVAEREPPSPADVGRTVERCSAEGCGFVTTCFRRA
jgi:ATP-dependent exoDNAse (exonuclease V) beta subunit